MKVLFINIPMGDNTLIGPILPLGILTIADALVKAGNTVVISDLNLISKSDYDKELSRLCLEHEVGLIALSLRNIDNQEFYGFEYYYPTLKGLLGIVKKYFPSVKIVIGGAGYTLFSKQIMEENKELDYGIPYEGDEIMVHLVDNINTPNVVAGLLIRNGNEIIATPKPDIIDMSKKKAIDYSLINIKPYKHKLALGVQGSRGCPLNCAYCCYPQLNGDVLRCRLVNVVISEIEQLNKMGAEYFVFADSIFDINKNYALCICNALIERNLPIKWSAWFSVGHCDEDIINAAYKAGCYRMAYSPDATTDRALAQLGKTSISKDVKRLFKLAELHPEIKFRISFIASIPGESWLDILSRIIYLFKMHVLTDNIKCYVSWMRYLPNAPVTQFAKQSGELIEEQNLLPPTIDKKEIKKIFYSNAKTPGVNFAIHMSVKLANFLRNCRKKIKLCQQICASKLSEKSR